MSSRNDLRIDGGGLRDDAEEAPRPIVDKLPAFYRENPGLVAPLADVAEDLISSLRLVVAAEEERMAREPRFAERSSWRTDAGTRAGLMRLLEERHGAAPLVWNGFEADVHSAGGLVFRRAASPSAIIAWEKTQLPAAPTGFTVPDGALPLGVRVAAVILGRVPRGGVPQSGERVSGEVIWRREVVEGMQRQ